MRNRLALLIAVLLTAAGCARAVGGDAVSHAPATPAAGTLPESAVTGPADRAPRWSEVSARGEGTIRVLYVPAEGWAYRDQGGRLTGVTVEIMRAFAGWVGEQHGVRVALDFVEEPDWRVFYRRVQEGEGGVFGLGNVTITEARREELRFSPPYLTNVAVLITERSVPELRDFADMPATFAGLTALAFAGTLHETRLRQLRDEYAPAKAIASATSNQEILERVAGGGYFAYVDAYNYWRAREGGLPLRHHPIGDDPAEEFGIIMPLDSDWEPIIAEFFAWEGGFRESSLYRQLLVEHLGEQVTRALGM